MNYRSDISLPIANLSFVTIIVAVGVLPPTDRLDNLNFSNQFSFYFDTVGSHSWRTCNLSILLLARFIAFYNAQLLLRLNIAHSNATYVDWYVEIVAAGLYSPPHRFNVRTCVIESKFIFICSQTYVKPQYNAIIPLLSILCGWICCCCCSCR